jgi:WD40 repeat protein
LNVAKKKTTKTFNDLNMYFAFTNSNGGGIYSPDGSLFAYATSSRTIKLINSGTFEVINEFSATDGAVKDITFSPNGKLLLAADQSGCIKFWDVAKGKALLNACVFKNLSDWIVYTPDGQVDGTPFGISQLYEVSSGEIRIISNAEAKRKPGLFYQVLKAYK